jgi:lipoprotein-anchoring transpeptidase ErfK/SrfK
MPRTRYRLAVVAVAALAAAGVARFVNGSEAATGQRQELPAATVTPADPPAAAGVPTPHPTGSPGVPPAPAGSPAVPTEPSPDQAALTTTTTAPPQLHATLSPGDGEVVGVGMPAVVAFDRPVAKADRPAVEVRLTVTADPPVEGDWRWITPALVHWRPATYWAPGTVVGLHSDLRGLQVGEAFGGEERTVQFRIGEAHLSTVDVATHQMTVTENGQVVKVIPMSAGRDRYPTHNGIHLALEKSRMVTMDSATVGIPRDSPAGYYRKVAWATRLSYSGTYVHAAPWSVGAQGERNVSHGCINVSPADAQWFYNFTRRGDVVTVVNSNAKPLLYDPGMADWNIPWEQWKVGDTAA